MALHHGVGSQRRRDRHQCYAPRGLRLGKAVERLAQCLHDPDREVAAGGERLGGGDDAVIMGA
jgi:hypothetical protein